LGRELSKIEIYRRVKSGNFPRPFSLGRKQAWPTAEVEAWLQQRMAVRDLPRRQSPTNQRRKTLDRGPSGEKM
jgi:hypothetical protein